MAADPETEAKLASANDSQLTVTHRDACQENLLKTLKGGRRLPVSPGQPETRSRGRQGHKVMDRHSGDAEHLHD